MIKYNVRSKPLLDIVNEITSKKLIISPYFQRKLVWRTIHKIDFIKTILMGLPFPELFIAKGDLNIEEMTSTSCVVDGQQRLNSILEYIKGVFPVDGMKYSDLDIIQKENFLKYEIAVIELDLKHDDSLIQEMFKRLNRTYYSLSNIEKIASEYAPSEFLLVAKLYAKELDLEEEEEDGEKLLGFDPNITPEFKNWARNQKVTNINKLIIDNEIFTPYEISRKVHLNFMLNILGTINLGIFDRNLDKDILVEYSEFFPQKDHITQTLEAVATKVLKLKFGKNSYWHKKANIFSLIIAFYDNFRKVPAVRVSRINEKLIKIKLENFEKNLPDEYDLAAKQGVNNKRERLIRNEHLGKLIDELISEQ